MASHANGFSLVRKILNEKNIKDEALISELLEPTRIYVQPMLKALEKTKNVRGIAHITGGGFIENCPARSRTKTSRLNSMPAHGRSPIRSNG